MAAFNIRIISQALGRNETMQVTPDLQIAQLRDRVARLFNIVGAQCLLYLDSAELRDSDTVQAAGIHADVVISVNERQLGSQNPPNPSPVVPRPQPLPTCTTVMITDQDARVLAVPVTATDTVNSLIAKTPFRREANQVCKLHLDDRELEGTQLIRDLHLPDRAALHLVVRVLGGVFH